MKKYILNSAVLTTFGEYSYSPISLEDMKAWLSSGDWESTIGYPETAEALRILTGVEVPVDRRVVKMLPGDEALVFRIAFPPGERRPDPSQKGSVGVDVVLRYAEFGLLKRIK